MFYRLPGKQKVQILAQKTTELQALREEKKHNTLKGFLFAPFQPGKNCPKLLIQPHIFTDELHLPSPHFARNNISVASKSNVVKLKESGAEGFKQLVKNITKEIKQGRFEKVIAARVEKAEKPVTFNEVKYFKRLCKKYPDAFVSLTYAGQYGTWIGASPEVLLQVKGTTFKTYSLAGTKANNKKNLKAGWGPKEMKEHNIVSRYISRAFSAVTPVAPVLDGPHTVAAGNLLHLRTTFLYKGVENNQWQKLVKQLHPTPAVAGLPKKEAVKYIIKNEKSPRAYYSGYLGPVNMSGEISLFVNIRCMQVLKNKVAAYVGCGITRDSKPESEWKESVIKTHTLLSVLNS